MLDDLKLIHTRDARDMLGTAGKQARWLEHDFGGVVGLASGGRYTLVAVFGEDTARIAMELALAGRDVAVPVLYVADTVVPAYVGPDCLCIVLGADGLEAVHENLSAALEARGARVVAYDVPDNVLAQQSLPAYMSVIGHALDMLASQEPSGADAATAYEQALASWNPEVAAANNLAKRLALEIVGKSVVVGGGPLLAPVAQAWKFFLNRNARHVAWSGHYPEGLRTELLGWTGLPVAKPYAVISLRSELEDAGLRQQMEVGKRLLSGRRPEPIVVEAQGATAAAQKLYLLGLGEFVSLYVAVLAGVEPSASPLLDKFDKEIS